MNKIIAAAAAMAVYKLATAVRAEAWFSITHEDITTKALALLEKEGKVKQAAFFNEHKQELIAGCTEPDREGDVDKGSGTHYYSYCTPKGKELPETKGYYRNRRGDFSKSARTMLEENYTSALCLYKSGKVDRSIRVLARAAHFIEDMCCTVHASNIRYMNRPKNIHSAFEKNINNLCHNFTAERFDKRLMKTYEGDSFEAAANKIIKSSAKFVEPISTLDPNAFRDAAAVSLPMAQQNVMALLLKFYDDCLTDKGNFIVDAKKYSFKNEYSGGLLTVNEKGAVKLDAQSKEKQQRFTVRISELGSFGLEAENGSFVNGSCKALEKAKDKPASFRLAALGQKRFRITTEGTKYAKALGCSSSGSITISDFDPADRSQVWVIV